MAGLLLPGYSCQCQTVSKVPAAETLELWTMRNVCCSLMSQTLKPLIPTSRTGRVMWRSPNEPPGLLHWNGWMMVVGAAISNQIPWPLLVLDGCVTAQDYQIILVNHVHPMVCTLKVVLCIRIIMLQYTQQNWSESGLMNMKVKLKSPIGCTVTRS